MLFLVTVSSAPLSLPDTDYDHEVFKPIDSMIVMKANQHLQQLDTAINQLHTASRQYDAIKRMMIDSKLD